MQGANRVPSDQQLLALYERMLLIYTKGPDNLIIELTEARKA